MAADGAGAELLAVVRLVMGLTAAHFAQQQRRLDRSQRGLPSLVLARSRQPASVERLLGRVAGEHAEPYRDAGVEGDPGEPVVTRVRQT